jgi:hypothetical protein
MLAWSMPGSQRASKPRIRARRVSASIIDCSSACPRCRLPVTFGGGMTKENGGLPLLGSAVK